MKLSFDVLTRFADQHRRALLNRRYRDPRLNTRAPDSITWVDTADGARLRVHSYGRASAPTLVLTHGWACCIEYWNPQINGLADRFHIVAYDQRGHGLSTSGDRPIDADVLADDLAVVLDQVLPEQTQAILVGHSMGGITLQAWAHRHPKQARERAAALVLANTTWGNIARGTNVLPLFNTLIPAPLWFGKLIFGAAVPLFGDPLTRALVRARVMDRRSATVEEAAFTLTVTRTCPPSSRAKAALMLAELELGADGVSAISAPTTVIAGRYDKLLPPIMSEVIAQTLEQNGFLEQYLVFDTGHAGNVEVSAAFNTELRRLAQAHLTDAVEPKTLMLKEARA